MSKEVKSFLKIIISAKRLYSLSFGIRTVKKVHKSIFPDEKLGLQVLITV